MTRLADALRQRSVPHTLRVAIDGPDAAGKTTLADDLASMLGPDREVIRISADDFHLPEAARTRRGALSAEGYYLDAFDHDAIVGSVLRPLGPDGDGRYLPACYDRAADQPVVAEPRQAGARAILLFDGVFLLRPELRDHWDLRVYLHAEPEETLRRALDRDVDRFGSPEAVRRRYRVRYLPAQAMYRMVASPATRADIVLSLADPAAPEIRRWSVDDSSGDGA
ncbi:MAG: uridine kinase [Dactylosporangium sp.]|nr:uridine kinase [Dactylosporangium sp.]